VRKPILLLPACVALLAACSSDPPPPADYPPNRPAPPTGQVDAQGSVNVPADPNSYADTDPSALTDFHGALDSHGTWVEDPTYGTVWVPASEEVGTDFAPYNTHGHWAYDNDDYVWVSDYDWGWAPFHYGRWTYINGNGWGWIPGRTYAGAWVDWRSGGAGYPYVGWAPTPPSYGWHGGVAVGLSAVPAPAYVYTRNGEVFSPGVHDHLIGPDQAPDVAAHTRPYEQNLGPAGGRGPAVATGGTSGLGIAPSAVTHTTAPSDVAHNSPTAGEHSSATGGNPTAHAGSTSGVAGVAQAQSFAKPNTAIVAGGHAPSPHSFRTPATQSHAAPTHYVAATAPHHGVIKGGGGPRHN
jgi:hypothetical protein